MANPFLQTHYRGGATDLLAEQIEEIRHLKNKVPIYMIVRDYHIRKKYVHDIGNNCEWSQQSKKYELEQKKKALGSKSIRVSNNSSEIIGEDLEEKKDTIDISPDSFSESSPNQSLIILQNSEDVSEMFKKVNIEMKKVRKGTYFYI